MVSEKFSKDYNLCVGMITAANGVKGYVRIRYFTDSPHDLENFKSLFDEKTKSRYKLKVISYKKDFMIAKIEGIENRNAAEKLQNVRLCISRFELPKMGTEEYYYADLIGLTVYDELGVCLGEVSDVANYGAGDIIEYMNPISNRTVSVPFNKNFVKEINIDSRYIVIYNAQEEVA